MIGKLTGTVDSITDDTVILDVHGVGYLVQCPSSTLARLSVGAPASLMIEMKVSEDAIKLYGFGAAEEREWFRLLQTVQNVGSKVALSVLSTLNPRDLQRALALGDKACFAHRHRTQGQSAFDDVAWRGRCGGGGACPARTRKRCGIGADPSGLFRCPRCGSGGARGAGAG
jgi:hypothetical protein